MTKNGGLFLLNFFKINVFCFYWRTSRLGVAVKSTIRPGICIGLLLGCGIPCLFHRLPHGSYPFTDWYNHIENQFIKEIDHYPVKNQLTHTAKIRGLLIFLGYFITFYYLWCSVKAIEGNEIVPFFFFNYGSKCIN